MVQLILNSPPTANNSRVDFPRLANSNYERLNMNKESKMVRYYFLAAAILLAASVSNAEDLTIRGLERGKAYTIEVAADGNVTITTARIVTVGQVPNPPPGPMDPPGNLTPFQSEISRLTKAAMAKGGTATTGAGVSSVYSLAADALNAGTLDVAVASDAVRRGTEAVMKAQKEQAAWDEFATALDNTITTLRAKGDLKTKAQFIATFRDVAKGMDAATGFKGNSKEVVLLDPATAGILGNIDLAKLIELIKLIMELFKLFSPAMGVM